MTLFRLIFLAMVGSGVATLSGCGGGSEAAGGASGDGGAGGSVGNVDDTLVTSGYVAETFGFFYPDSLESQFVGFDLDERVSNVAAPAPDECAHDDFVTPDGQEGIDYNFLRVILTDVMDEAGEFLFGGFREGQLVDGVINGAVKNGSMTVLVDIQGLDDPQNDDEVTVQVFGSEDSPMKGTDDEVLPFATLSVHPEVTYHTQVVTGRMVDGVLTAGPLDLIFPIDIQIVSDEFVIREAWVRIELGEDRFDGIITGLWDVANIRDILGKPTTDNGNAANFNIEQFEEAMATHADVGYDEETGSCRSFSAMFQFSGVQAWIARGSGDPGIGGSGGSGGAGGDGPPINTPVDQCVNPADEMVLQEIGGLGPVGGLAAECPATSCGAQLTDVLTSGGSDAARIALGDCIAQCITDGTGLSRDCTDCYGAIAACSTSFCLQPCAADPGSMECQQCALDNCPDLGICTGL